jgi:hypothetical protein
MGDINNFTGFDPAFPLFDFRTPQRMPLTFMYILPYDPRTPCVEYTLSHWF